MMNDLTTPGHDVGHRGNGKYTSLLRRALAEVVELSASAVEPLESEIESQYATARSEAQRRFDIDKERIERDLRLKVQEVQWESETQIKDAESEYEGRLSALKVEIQQRRKRVMQTAAELESKTEKEKQNQLLEIEFVAEGAATKRKQKSFEAKTTAEESQRRLDNLDAQANHLIRQYRCRDLTPSGAPGADTGDGQDPAEVLRSQQALAEQRLIELHNLRTAQLFVGVRPVLFAGGLLGAAGIPLGILHLQNVSVTVAAPIALALASVLIVVGGRALWKRGQSQARRIYGEIQVALMAARMAMGKHSAQTLDQIEKEWLAAVEQKQAELRRTETTYETTKVNLAKQQAISLRQVEDQRQELLNNLRESRDQTVQKAQELYEREKAGFESQFKRSLAEIQKRFDEEMAACERKHETARKSLEDRWDQGLARIDALLRSTAGLDKRAAGPWDHLLGESWTPSQTPPAEARFAAVNVDFGCLADSVTARAGSMLDAARFASLPAMLEFPDHCSLLLEYPREGREQAIDTLRAVMMRLFASFPPGQARFTIFDPVGLGESFAGFMHAGDYLESLVGGRIWTEPQQIQEQLEDLTEHMENVIQKYLRNEFETIEQYNRQAGELAEPYRFLVIADFPRNFSEETARRLSSVIHSGPRCGVHTLIAYDTRADLPSGVDMRDICAASVHLAYEDGRFVWRDDVLRQFPLVLDAPPDEAALTQAMHVIGKAGAASARVEVPFTAIAPTEDEFWSLSSSSELRVPLGRTGATRLQYLSLGRGVAQHMLIAGKTGSGKSTLLHAMITNLALWYAPDQVELYLIDFKQGVEFKTYATNHLPHARAIAIESDREFGLSILQRLDAEMTRRGDLFRQAGVQDLAAYRKATGKPMPRTVLVVDEFQVFFADDDKLAQDAAVLLEQLVRQGRAFGIHVVLGSQTLGGVFGLARSTIGQMAVRIALQCSDADSQLILDDDNMAARLLSRPGEAIYNDAGGRLTGNSPFQTAWLADATRDGYLSRVRERVRAMHASPVPEPAIVFEGSAPADIRENRQLEACLDGRTPMDATAPRIWLGAPVTIKEPTAVAFRRQSGSNVLIVGQRDDLAKNLMSAAILSLAAQIPPSAARFLILDGSAPDSAGVGAFERIAAAVPHECRNVGWHDVVDAIGELARQADARVQESRHDALSIFLMIFGLQRYRMLRRSEDVFSLSRDEEAAPRCDVQFADLLREGPTVGIHTLIWANTLSTLERTLDRQTIHEFDHRVLFQMSTADSSNLIDSPIANQLGLHRALLHSEEQGGMERFRPYAAIPSDWLEEAGKRLGEKCEKQIRNPNIEIRNKHE
ncbi:MAG TPA: FtsK/SpoIIIE domain-containing protein [Sedimentisphaerales bacterium]|nr:FtsK/SpoIIIE domain-containing protein [Sedimentisphaerales bacterium]